MFEEYLESRKQMVTDFASEGHERADVFTNYVNRQLGNDYDREVTDEEYEMIVEETEDFAGLMAEVEDALDVAEAIVVDAEEDMARLLGDRGFHYRTGSPYTREEAIERAVEETGFEREVFEEAHGEHEYTVEVADMLAVYQGVAEELVDAEGLAESFMERQGEQFTPSFVLKERF